MTPTPPSTTSSSAGGHSPDTQYRVVRKRNRVPLSCGPCRHRKLKCNRSNPCENCIRRGDASSCSYAAPGTRKKNQSQGATTPDDMQNRIDRLEGLVLSLMTNGAQSAGPAAAAAAISRSQSNSTGSLSFPLDAERGDDNMIREEEEDEESDVEGVTNSLGVLKVDPDRGKAMYFGDSHWHMVLADIAEVKNYFSQHKKDLENNYERIKQSKPNATIGGPTFLFSSNVQATDTELRAEIPSKSAVDKLVTRYFNSYDPAVHILHSPTFHNELRDYWQNPAQTSLVWLGLLYSIMCLAMQSYHKIGDEPPEWRGRTLDLAAEYRLRTVQCLINSDYTKPVNYTIETLLLYVHGEWSSRWDAEVGIWVIVGMIVRLAMRMGYHRDSSNYQSITPYQGEMRRRVWAFIRQLDTMFSFQLALPGMIRNSDCDATIPRNIFEDEFSPESKTLPPSRPSTEPTPISYMITKSKIAFEFGAILEEINAVDGRHISYDDVMKRDNRLREVRNAMPPHLKLRPMEECTHDPATLLMERFNLDIMWQKTICVLHRKYLARARVNQRYAHSRRACVDASMEILRHQAKLHREAEPGGRMRTMKWYISSLTKQDYLLAAMIVCLDLHCDSVSEACADPSKYNRYFWTPAEREAMLKAIETSYELWNESAESSVEAYKASNILSVLLKKLKQPKPAKVEAPTPTTAEVFAQFDQEKPEHSAAMTLGMLSGGLSPNSAAMFNNVAQSPRGAYYPGYDVPMGDSTGTGLTPNFASDASNSFGALNGVASPFSVFGNTGNGAGFEMPTNLDWEAWDSYIQNGNSVDPVFQFYPANDQNLNQDGQPTQNQQPTGQSNFGNSVFMGANTPGR
ncbi:fungal-specific transcription factor domain-containing protein [Bisporella sp. PMI_857]|nr:fungal-specific transcription factor domain-containing protein [Bisporella sp. PMI_857]